MSERPRLPARAGRYVARRVFLGGLVPGAGLRGAVADLARLPSAPGRGAWEALWRGVHEDGGRARFAAKFAAVPAAAIEARARDHRRTALAAGALGVAILAAGLVLALRDDVFAVRAAGIGLAAIATALFAFGLRCDFDAWRLEARRFGGLRDHLDARLGRASGDGGRCPRS